MAKKKNRAKNTALLNRRKRCIFYPHRNCGIVLPQEIMELLDSYFQRGSRQKYPLHHVFTVGITKSWMPTVSSRCCKSVQGQWPRLCSIDSVSTEYGLSPYDSSFKNSPGNCVFKDKTVARVGHQIVRSHGYIQPQQDKYECIVLDSFDTKKGYMDLVNVVSFERNWGKLCAVSLQGSLVVIEHKDSRATITGISSDRTVPSVSSRFFKEYLVTINEELFVVFFIHAKSLAVVDQVEVFRLCFDKLKWIKVERLQGKTLFLGQKCIWMDSAEIGCRGDCVYFTHGLDNSWWLYDMEKCSILPL